MHHQSLYRFVQFTERSLQMIKVRPSAEIYRSASTAHGLSLASAYPWEVFHRFPDGRCMSMSIMKLLVFDVHIPCPLQSICPSVSIICLSVLNDHIGAKACPGMRTEPAASEKHPEDLLNYLHIIVLYMYHNISQYITIYINISQYITIYHNISQYITIYHNIS